MRQYEVIVNTSVADRPKDHEMKAALIVANNHFRSDVVFLRPEIYKTPDLEINSARWELKSPLGQGKKTIENNMRAARRQSENFDNRLWTDEAAPDKGASKYTLLHSGIPKTV